MTNLTFAGWVDPLAASYRENHAEVVRLARRLTDEQLSRPTGDEGWAVRTEIVHIAASDPDFAATLGAILEGRTPDLSIFADIDARNARNLEAWQERSIDDVASALEESGEALQGLLARLSDEDEARQPDGMPFPLGQLIRGYGQHGSYHLGQMQRAIGQGR